MTDDMVRERVEAYLQLLRERGCRLTEQRRIIIETLLENAEASVSVRDLAAKVHEKDASVGFATVYRTLLILEEMDILHQTNLGEGFSPFVLSEKAVHVHLRCRVCGAVPRMEQEDAKEKILGIGSPKRDSPLVPQSVQLAGICEECRASRTT
jgi:Fur family ferric uptake transcriptional regulator